ncbi:MAG TPA: TIGR00730 family Rossman fold protein [Caulobacteraceae bacterium]|nr:TIGR00730 family Rossman fold protein [Caulobacteraceae bacterium]
MASQRLESVCVYCASSSAADPDFLSAAAALGRSLADAGLRLVYGGGGLGLMGACARAAHERGGRVLGVIPHFLTARERPLARVETVIVASMHERKLRMFDEADAFAILPGGIGTLEEVIEILSWRRLGLHAKPIVFLNAKGFWNPLFEVFEHILAQDLAPSEFRDCWRAVEDVGELLPALRAMPTLAFMTPPGVEEMT